MSIEATIRPFRYVEEVDGFIATDAFKEISDELGLSEWHEAVWMGRLFNSDNDFGEHWFDNWELRETVEEKAKELGIYSGSLLIIDPARFCNGKDGPCNPPELRKAYWTDVLKSMTISYDVLFERARLNQKEWMELDPDDEECIHDLEERIDRIKKRITSE